MHEAGRVDDVPGGVVVEAEVGSAYGPDVVGVAGVAEREVVAVIIFCVDQAVDVRRVGAADDVADALYAAAQDRSVKAIVFRESSPGGSDTASEEILAAVRAAKANAIKAVSFSPVVQPGVAGAALLAAFAVDGAGLPLAAFIRETSAADGRSRSPRTTLSA